MVPVKVRVQGMEKLVQGGGYAYDAEPEVILRSPLVSGRLYTLPSHGPRMASPPAAVKPFALLPSQKLSQRCSVENLRQQP